MSRVGQVSKRTCQAKNRFLCAPAPLAGPSKSTDKKVWMNRCLVERWFTGSQDFYGITINGFGDLPENIRCVFDNGDQDTWSSIGRTDPRPDHAIDITKAASLIAQNVFDTTLWFIHLLYKSSPAHERRLFDKSIRGRETFISSPSYPVFRLANNSDDYSPQIDTFRACSTLPISLPHV